MWPGCPPSEDVDDNVDDNDDDYDNDDNDYQMWPGCPPSEKVGDDDHGYAVVVMVKIIKCDANDDDDDNVDAMISVIMKWKDLRTRKAQIALPPMAFSGVVKTP